MSICVRLANFTAGTNFKVDGVAGPAYPAQFAFILDETQTQPCPNYTILTGSEFTGLPSIMDIFTIPLTADLQQMWMLGFSTPLIAYLTAWSYGVVINWFNDRKHH